MTISAFENAMCEISEKYIAEAINYSKATTSYRPKQRFSIVSVAAIMALFLLGAGVVTVIFGDSIQSWFEYHWERITGQTMSEEHSAVIEHLSQEIGISETIGETTVTVDSATIGDDIIYMLLRVTGPSLNKRYAYTFDNYHMEVTPEPLDDATGMGAVGFQFYDLDADGSALFLVEFGYATTSGFEADTSPLEVTLTLENFLRIGAGNKDKLLTKGAWNFTFTIDRSHMPDSLSLSDTEVTFYNREAKMVTTQLTSIVLTNTGIRFHCAPEAEISNAEFLAVLENGGTVNRGSGIGVPLADSDLWIYSYHWEIPINLNEIIAIQIGQTKIPAP